MNITKFQKIFGIGLWGTGMIFGVLGLLWLLDWGIGPVEISSNPVPIKLIGSALVLVWICWHIWAIRTIRAWWLRDQLCRTGPFQYVRHPMYAGSVLFFCPGIALLLNSWIILLWPVFSYLIWSVLVQKEEGIMSAVFREEYTAYASQTGRLLPRLLR